MEEFKTVATINFRVTSKGSLEDAYLMMKNYQLVNQAGRDSNIIYNGVSIPAGDCESLEEVKILYQELKSTETFTCRQREFDVTNVEVDFYTEEDNLAQVFEAMQQYRNHGYANKYSNIVYRGVVIPAGYCDSISELEAMYDSIITGDISTFFESVSSGVLSHSLVKQYEVERGKIIYSNGNRNLVLVKR